MGRRFNQPAADIFMTVAMMGVMAIMGRSSAGLGFEAATFATGVASLAFGLFVIGRNRDTAGRWRLVVCGIVMVATLAAAIFSPP
jgi:hypothetical protein